MRLAVFVLIAMAVACEGRAPATKQQACLEQLTVDPHRSVHDEQGAIGPPAADFQRRFAAADIDPTAQRPVAATAAYEIAGTPLLWWNAGLTEAVVNAAVLTELRVIDATRIATGSTETVGRLSERGVGRIAGRDLVKFLIAARVIATYVHAGAELCIAEEHDDPTGYRARITGHHTFYTNTKNVEPLAFTVTIKPDGTIAVRGD